MAYFQLARPHIGGNRLFRLTDFGILTTRCWVRSTGKNDSKLGTRAVTREANRTERATIDLAGCDFFIDGKADCAATRRPATHVRDER